MNTRSQDGRGLGMDTLTTEVLVVGGGTGATAAALQAARRGARVVLVSEFTWLGGMLTAAGVSAPDGNELEAFQTGLWGAFLQALRERQPGGLDHAWVSFFTYEPRVGAAILADWVKACPNLTWIAGQTPTEVIRQGDRIMGVRFQSLMVKAQVVLDGTDLGDLLALGEVPHCWGWEERSMWQEPSAPHSLTDPQDALAPILRHYPIQSPTWVVVMQDYGIEGSAPPIPPPPHYDPASFEGAWEGYGGQSFLNYGRLPNQQFMINWPQKGNDYGHDLQLLIQSEASRHAFHRESQHYSQGFAHFIQSQLGSRYGLAQDAFVSGAAQSDLGGLALYPYYREGRRLVGLTTVCETDILPIAGGQVAALPRDEAGNVTAIAIGNYPNDHHYPGFDMPLAPKSIRWGGRWTGTPFTIPYTALVSATVDGLLVCDKAISVSHIANGATRLQPTVLGIGQAAGMAAALCIELDCQPRDLPIRSLQQALLTDPVAPNAVIPLLNLSPDHPEWLTWQQTYLDQPETYPRDGYATIADWENQPVTTPLTSDAAVWGTIEILEGQQYRFHPDTLGNSSLPPDLALVTLNPHVDHYLKTLTTGQSVSLIGRVNLAGHWLIASSYLP